MRAIHAHPEDPTLLIKVVHPHVLDVWRSGSTLYRKLRRTGPNRTFARELDEHVALLTAGEADLDFLETVVGIVATDLGPGLVVRAVFGRDGHFAPTLGKIVRDGRYDGMAASRLDRFLDRLLGSDVIINDFKPANVVFGSEDGRSPRFVLVDGIGETNWVPLSSLSRRWNRRRKEQKIAALQRWVAKRCAPELRCAAQGAGTRAVT